MAERTDHDNFFLISMDKIDDTQRRLVHAQIELLSISWWHQQTNVWIVRGGDSSVFWRDLLAPFVQGVPGNLYVFRLPDRGQRWWASQGPKVHAEWLHTDYTNAEKSPEIEV